MMSVLVVRSHRLLRARMPVDVVPPTLITPPPVSAVCFEMHVLSVQIRLVSTPAVMVAKMAAVAVRLRITVLPFQTALSMSLAERMNEFTDVVPNPFHWLLIAANPSTVLAAPVDLITFRKFRMPDVSAMKQSCSVNHFAVV